MDYYVIQLLTGKEELFLKHAHQAFSSDEKRFFWLRKELVIKKLGTKKKKISSIFPGYIFVETDSISYDDFRIIKNFPGFCRFLKANSDIKPLPSAEKKLIYNLCTGGNIAGISIVYFNENDRIKVVSGPLKDLEGKIIKVDKRKKRAKIKLNLYENSFLIDFGFELIEPLKNDK